MKLNNDYIIFYYIFLLLTFFFFLRIRTFTLLAGTVSSLVWIVLLLGVLSCDALTVPLIFIHIAPPTVKQEIGSVKF